MKNKVFSIIFVSILCFFMLLSIILPDQEISISERRKLASFPNIQLETVFNGKFFEDLGNYLVEQFPCRNLFRSIKGMISKNIFRQQNESGVFIKDNALYQLNPTLNEKSLKHFTNLLNNVDNNYLKTNHLYYTIVPDKNYYLDDSIPKMDYKRLELLLHQELPNMKYIDIKNNLGLDSYYATDIHWKQEKLEPVVNTIEREMGLKQTTLPKDIKRYSKFYGSLYGRVANFIKPDELTYLTDYEIEQAIVFDYETQMSRKIYEERDTNNMDSYDIYLGGAKAFLVIENDNSSSNKELILFRDSFGSSIAPLFVPNYSRIIMIDLRYVNSNLLNQLGIDWNQNQDILFLYSVPIINNSFTLK